MMKTIPQCLKAARHLLQNRLLKLKRSPLKYEKDIPVDRVVDERLKQETSLQESDILGGAQIATGGTNTAYIWISLMSFFSLLTFIGYQITNKLGVSVSNLAKKTLLLMSRPTLEAQSPSLVSPPLETDLSSVMEKLGELEAKVNCLQSRSVELPNDKEELLNAAVCRVDALEAELIATKKALHEALMKQDELLAFVDGQKRVKSGEGKRLCW